MDGIIPKVWVSWVRFNLMLMASGIIVLFLAVLGVWKQYLTPAGMIMFLAGLCMELFLEYILAPILNRRYT